MTKYCPQCVRKLIDNDYCFGCDKHFPEVEESIIFVQKTLEAEGQ